jgi:hypothetical protein
MVGGDRNMTIPRKPRKTKSRTREKAISTQFVRELLNDLESAERALTIAKLNADHQDDYRERMETLVLVVAQQGMVLSGLLLALEEDADS